jgi:RNA polymerase sigma-70 factor (ECF subfamily)
MAPGRRKEMIMLGSIACDSSSVVFLFPRQRQAGMRRPMDRRADVDASSASGELASLLQAVSRGDRAAFAEVYRRTSAKLYGICLRLLGTEAEAQDALQEVYVLVWRKAERFDSAKAGAITWLSVLARNKAIDRLRRRSIGTADLEAAADVEDDGPSAFEIVGDAEDAARLNRCLDELDERPRAMIRAAFLDGASYPELAEREQVPLGTLKSWVRRALQRLRGCLER